MTPNHRTQELWREEYPFASHHLAVPAGRLHFVDEGPRSRHAVVCVHGNPTWSFYYRHAISELSKTRRVIAVDNIGCGLSDKPQDWPYRLAGHIENLTLLIDHLGLDQVDLIVHDWGGAIGLGWAGAHAARVGKLVVTNTGAFPSPHFPVRLRLCRLPGLGALMIRGGNAFAGLALSMAASRPLSPLARAGLLHPYGNWHDRIATHRFVQDIPFGPGDASWETLLQVEAGLKSLASKEMLLLWGPRDFVFNDTFLGEFKTRFPSAAVRRYDWANHYVFEDARAECLAELRTFLGSAST